MSKKIDERIPKEVGKGALPDHPAVKTPWEKLISFHDAYHYIHKHLSLMDADFMQVLRIVVPEYEDRANRLCTTVAENARSIYNSPFGVTTCGVLHVHPFMKGNFIGGLIGDAGDERLLMCGRVNDFGTHRVEKELDVCYWDIVGSEFCRTTVVGLQNQGLGLSQGVKQTGTNLDYAMVEAKGCGDLHCRIVAEDREKFPMPEHKIWESFGPVATADQIKFTAKEEMVDESMIFRKECNYCYTGGTCQQEDAAESYVSSVPTCLANYYMEPVFKAAVEKGEISEKTLNHIVRCVFEACGKSMYRDWYASEGLRDWMGVPDGVKDGRVLGAYIEMLCQMLRAEYEVEAFNEEEVIYRINRDGITYHMPRMGIAYLAMWNGMCKTLVGTEWFCWEEDSDDVNLRVKIAKKIDKFC